MLIFVCFIKGGPNIAAEIWQGEYANARICGTDRDLRAALAEFIRNDNFVVWTSPDMITHEVLGGLKNVYAIGMGITTAATNNSATSKAVYFSNAAAEMVFITRLLSKHPEDLQGPLLADTYVTLLKGRNAWYGECLGKGELNPSMGHVIPGKGLIQGISAVHAFYKLLSDSRVKVYDRDKQQEMCPVQVLPLLCSLRDILTHDGDMIQASQEFITRLKDASATDPAERLRTENLYCAMLTRLPCEMTCIASPLPQQPSLPDKSVTSIVTANTCPPHSTCGSAPTKNKTQYSCINMDPTFPGSHAKYSKAEPDSEEYID